MAWDAAIGGGASTFGSIYGANKSAKSAKKVMQMQIAWERERAQNAHQWEVKDLEAAGLNPILSAGGQGAATSGVSGQMPDTSGYGQAGEALLNSAKAINDIKNQTKLAEAQSNNLDQDTTNKVLEAKNITPRAKAQIKQMNTSSAVNNARTNEIQSNIALNSAKRMESYANAEYQGRRAGGYSKNWSNSIGPGGVSKGYSTTY